jgi:hypothetical protein
MASALHSSLAADLGGTGAPEVAAGRDLFVCQLLSREADGLMGLDRWM